MISTIIAQHYVVVMQTTGAKKTGESYKISLYFPILDAIISELQNRFGN